MMEKRELGNTGLKVSAVGFGASPLGHVFGDVSHSVAVASVRRALDLGINFFDTSPSAFLIGWSGTVAAPISKYFGVCCTDLKILRCFSTVGSRKAGYYGGTVSESVLGECFKEIGVPRDQIIVATKCGRYREGFDFSAERVTRSVDESLARLGLDYVDILHCHDIEFVSLDQIVNETIPALQKIKEKGKARFIGITGLPLNIYTYVLDRVPPGTVDVILSYCHFSINDSTLVDLLPYLKSKGAGVITASPLAMGLLTDNGPPSWHPASDELKSACKVAAEHCRKKGKSIMKIAMQYSLLNKDISTVLVGMNSPSQVEENVAAALELSSEGIDKELLDELENILEPVKNQTWPSGIQQS